MVHTYSFKQVGSFVSNNSVHSIFHISFNVIRRVIHMNQHMEMLVVIRGYIFINHIPNIDLYINEDAGETLYLCKL